MTTPIISALTSLKLEQPQSFRNLAMFPLIAEADPDPAYLTLDEALDRGLARVTEVSESGSVPDLRFDNDSDSPVLLVDGEELVGARQNRVLNLTILVAAHAKVVIPVTCVERGRWAYKARRFHSAKRGLYAKARAAKMEQVTRALKVAGSRRSDQFAVWEDIALKFDSLNVESPTEAMSDLYERQHARVDQFQKALRPSPREAGAVFALNGEIVGVELFDAARTFAKLMEKLVGTYAMDAIDVPDERCEVPSLEDVAVFLERIKAASASVFPAVGEGQDVRLEGAGVSGGALVHEDRVVHLSAFAVQERQ